MKNKVIILLLIFRYIVIYLPVLFFDSDYVINTEPYDLYTLVHYICECLFIAVFVFGLSFFTKIKELKKFIYVMAFIEFWETIKMYCFMTCTENIIFHNTKDWEMYLGIGLNIITIAYFTIKYKRNEKINSTTNI